MEEGGGTSDGGMKGGSEDGSKGESEDEPMEVDKGSAKGDNDSDDE